MKSRIPLLKIGVSLLTLINLLPQVVNGKKDEPAVTITPFDNQLEDVFYFDDSNVVLGLDATTETVWRSDDAGETWDKVDNDHQAGNSYGLWPHPFNNQRAYIIGEGKKHWMTKDQGKTWKSFSADSVPTYFGNEPLKFHGRDPQRVIWNGEDCRGGKCGLVAYYTDDDFATATQFGNNIKGCQWAVSTPTFGEDNADDVEDRIFCVKGGLYSIFEEDNRLVWSDDYFKTENEPPLDNGRAVQGIISMAAVKKYIVAAANSDGTTELALYVTADGNHWHRAEFGDHRVNEDAYTILESTNYSMQVDVLGSKRTDDEGAMGYLFTSNSNGTYFTRNIAHTNRNTWGRVDFEKVQNIQGIILVNIVKNADAVDSRSRASKKVISQISFDDGRTFEDLTADGKQLHLHSVTDAVQNGRIFSSPAPGIVMGVGNTGEYLKPYKSGDLYVSDDAGRTWRKALDGPHMYEFGNNGAVLVAVDSAAPAKEISWSLNHGKDWSTTSIEQSLEVAYLTTVPDSTTLKFLMGGAFGAGKKRKWGVFKIDFGGLKERTCGEDDFERWTARLDDDGEPSCVMGHKQFFRRRKAEAECFIDADFRDPQPEFERCTCTAQDFECDFNFARDAEDKTKCNPLVPIADSKGKCKKETDTFMATSGFRLIPGNECDRSGGVKLDKEIERSCKDAMKAPSSGEVGIVKNDFKAQSFVTWHYVERVDSAHGDDETIIMQDSEQHIFISRDHGKKWEQILKGEPIKQIVPHPYFYDMVYFLTGSKKVHYTADRGEHFGHFDAPRSPISPSLQVAPTLRFHHDYQDWLLWSGVDGLDDHITVSLSKDRGDDWQTLARGVRKCEFIHRRKEDELIYCEQFEKEDPSTQTLHLFSSENFFADKTKLFDDILDFATMAEFIVVAAKEEDQKGLKVDASVDGATFAKARFPSNFQVQHQQAYTVLDSSTHAIFLHVTVNPLRDQAYGTILKSNSNGTSYVMTYANVNRDDKGYVDFEKMQGLEGVAMINVVSNIEEVKDGVRKKLKSMITHNDGAQWGRLPPPKKDALGKDYECVKTDGVATDECSLHIHSYTERLDKTATFSSPSAIGLMMAVGNVGPFLDRKEGDNTDTFITQDAGITWKSVKKGSYLWEFGDQGSIIVIVPERKATRVVFYTLDEGETWTEFPFAESDMEISAITTVPGDNSFNFLLWGRESRASGTVSTISLDFSQLTQRQRECELDESRPEADDYYLWQPSHPLQGNNCLFGHRAGYHRKRPEAECYNGKRIDRLHMIEENCACTRSDFECAYNFEMSTDGSCQLVEGLQSLTREEYCKKNPEAREYSPNVPYRRVPISTCVGGDEYDKINVEPCPGYEKEFERKHRIGGVALFFAIIIPIAAACGIGYWVWQRYKTYGFGNFGQIRLGESVMGGRSSGGQSALIAVPVAIVAGLWAVAKAIPLLASSAFRSAKGYAPVGSRTGPASGPYRSRDAFSRQQDYTSAAFVEDDELLDEYDEVDGEDV